MEGTSMAAGGNGPSSSLAEDKSTAEVESLLSSCILLTDDALLAAEDKTSLLQLAVKEERVEIVEKLLEKGADPRLKDNRGHNCLHVAAAKGNVELVRLLVKDVNIINEVASCDNTALHIAVVCGRWYPSNNWISSDTVINENKYMETVSELLISGADPNLRDRNSETPLNLIVKNMCKIHYCKMIDLLVAHGAQINSLDKYNFTPLFTAMRWRNIEIAKHLVKIAAGSENKVMYLKKYLLEAFFANCEEIVDVLLDKGADVNRVYASGVNLLNVVLKNTDTQIRSLEIVKFMMQKGARLEKHHRIGVDDATWEKAKNLYREIVRMKITKVCDSSEVTYYDVLSKRNHALIRCLRDRQVYLALQSRGYMSTFENFSARLMYNFLRGCERIRRLNRLHQTLSSIFEDSLPKKAVAIICLYFNDKELEKFAY